MDTKAVLRGNAHTARIPLNVILKDALLTLHWTLLLSIIPGIFAVVTLILFSKEKVDHVSAKGLKDLIKIGQQPKVSNQNRISPRNTLGPFQNISVILLIKFLFRSSFCNLPFVIVDS